MSELNLGNNEGTEDLRLGPSSLPGWDTEYLGENPFSTEFQVNESYNVPSHQVITPITTLDEERHFRNSVGASSGEFQYRETRGLGEAGTKNVSINEQDLPSDDNCQDWPISEESQCKQTSGLGRGHLVDNSYVEPTKYSADNFFYSNTAPYSSSLGTHSSSHLSFPIPDQPDHLKGGSEELLEVGNLHGDNGKNLTGKPFDGPDGSSTAAIDGGMYSCPSTSLPMNDDSLGEFRCDLQTFSDQIEQASLALSTPLALSSSQYHPPSSQPFNLSAIPFSCTAPIGVNASAENYNFMSSEVVPSFVPPLAQPLHPATNISTINELPDPRNNPFEEMGGFKPPSSLNASYHNQQLRAFPGPGNFGPSPPVYSAYPVSYSPLRYDSLVKPLSPSSSSFEMDPSTFNTPKTPPYSSSVSSPSTADARSSKKRSSLSGHITFPSPIKEFNYDCSTLITKKSRGRRPLTLPDLGKWSPDNAQFPNVESKLAPDGPLLGSLCSIVSDDHELLNLMEAGKANKIKKAFVCQVDGCGKCFRRCEHLRRHVRTIHSAEKPYQCPWPTCKRNFNRNDNLKQHFQVHIRKSEVDH
ncbi:hypothetical protein PCANC_23521 [Puccinia coronata f. sp. avenae]|uniref:C2H2-type domain-containing protein n=1 Tax=Puccinia coronata f. sp. avenae TaxID=200324 RepID=A0A2N5S2M4_9BASI|nr:hypothetical protein PCANC_23521 [Puccinia coronata f. sp. avenae]